MLGIKGVYVTDLVPLKNDFLPKIKYFKDGIGIQFNYTPLVVAHIIQTKNILNAYIVYELYNWPRNLLRNFTLKNCLSGATNIVKHSDKEKYVYSGYGIAFDRKDELSFNNYTTRNVIVFGVNNNSSSHSVNLKNDNFWY